MLTVKALAKLVLEVRAAQKRYFASRENVALVESKRLEKQLDDEAEKIVNPSLFDREQS